MQNEKTLTPRRKKSANGEGSIYKRGEYWYVSYSANGIQRKESTGSKLKSDAIKLRNQRITEFTATGRTSSPGKKVRIDELLDDLLTAYRREGKKSVECWAVHALKPLRAHFGRSSMAEVNSKSLESYIEVRKTPSEAFPDGRANGTINRELALLRRAFNVGARRFPPKVQFVPAIPMLPEAPSRRGFFEFREYTALLETLPEDIRPIAIFAYNTGCRKGEIVNLRWDQVDFARAIVELREGETKNNEARKIPLCSAVLEMLHQRKSIRDRECPETPHVFFRRESGCRVLSFKTAWSKACSRIGKPEALFHDFRRTGVRNLIRSGVSETVAMKISGHKDRTIFSRYDVTSELDLLEAAQKLSRYQKQGT